MLEDDELMVITAGGQAARLTAADIPVQGRATQGKQGVKVPVGDRVVEVSRVASERGERKGGAAAGPEKAASAAPVAANAVKGTNTLVISTTFHS